MPYINLDQSEFYHRAHGVFIGEWCLLGIRANFGKFGWNIGVIVFNISAGFYGE